MGEKIDSEEIGETSTHDSVSLFLSSLETSPEFEGALEKRKQKLSYEHPEMNYKRDDLVLSLRMSPAYREVLFEFHNAGNKLPKSIEIYNQEAQTAIREYWEYIKNLERHETVLRATAPSEDIANERVFKAEKKRDSLHVSAALALLGDGIILENGKKITCKDIDKDDEDALSLGDYTTLGRSLISIITEENELDIFDPKREEKKTAATLDYLNDCRYVGGHWVGKGEK